MKVLYQSEITGKTYQTKQALVEAEKAITEAKKQEVQAKTEVKKETKIPAKPTNQAKPTKEAK